MKAGGEAPTYWVVAGNLSEFRDYCESRGFSPYKDPSRPFSYLFAVYSLYGLHAQTITLIGSYEARQDWKELEGFIMKSRRAYIVRREPVTLRPA